MQARKRKKIFGNKTSKFDDNAKQPPRKPKEDEEIDEEIATIADEELDQSVIEGGFSKKRKNKQNDEDEGKEEEEDPFANETPEEKRIRLAKEYLHKFELLNSESTDAADLDREILTQRLKQDVIVVEIRSIVADRSGDSKTKSQPKHQRQIADQLVGKTINVDGIKKMRGHQLSVTSIALTSDDKFVFSASKDCTIIKWDVETGKKLHQFPGQRKYQKGLEGHVGEVLALAVSSDGKFLASGGKDKLVRIWDAQNNKLLESFKGHRDVIGALTFREGTHQLFSGSNDRTIKIWDLDEMIYGHQSEILGLDAGRQERAVSCSRDKTVHMWKVPEETQLVFRGHVGSTDCVTVLNESMFFSGSDDGSIALWNSQKKKPIAVVKNAHTQPNQLPNWISSVTACKNSNLVASGSCDGTIKLWKADTSAGALSAVLNVPMVGFVNSLALSNAARFIVAGIGQEHKLGRWSRIKEAKNGIQIVPLPQI